MPVSEQQVQTALKELVDPNTQKDFITSKSAKNIKVEAGKVTLDVSLPYPAKMVMNQIKALVEDKIKSIPGVTAAEANVSWKVNAHSVQRGVKLIPGVKNIIAVASGKGGVGKSTTAVNLALALAAEGATVGVLDADIYGPSQPTMLGITGRPESADGESLEPMIGHGLQAMSIGFLIDVDTPMVWRGPMVTQALEQLLNQTKWKDIDYLVVDLPPGTGDVPITMIQQTPVDGVVVVCTPQDVALLDARKAIAMLQRAQVPIVGIIENMSFYQCPDCGRVDHIFGEGGAVREAQRHGVPLLGAIPLDVVVRESGDAGTPIVVARPDGPHARAFRDAARALIRTVEAADAECAGEEGAA